MIASVISTNPWLATTNEKVSNSKANLEKEANQERIPTNSWVVTQLIKILL
jgi:hypothetical protein